MILLRTKTKKIIFFFGLVLFFCLFSSLAFAQTFNDVPPDYWAYSYIEAAYKTGLAAGTSTNPPQFSPEGQVTRAQMTVFLARAMKLPDYTGPQIFSDVPPTYWAFSQIGAIYLAGITVGTTATTFSPEQVVNRAQMAAFLCRAVKLDTSIYDLANPSTWAVNFSDVPTTHWAWKSIQAIYEAKIASGTSSTTYSPDAAVTRAQMAVFLCRTFDIQVFVSAKVYSTVSSSTETAPYYDDNTLDNNLTTYWQGKSASSPWWLKYDLGSIYNLSYVTIYWHKDYGAANYDLQISNDNLSWTTVYSAQSTPASTTNPVKVLLELTGKSARYLRIYIKSAKSTYPIIYEVYIYGYKITDSTPPTVSISSPLNNSFVSGTTAVQANAADNVAVLKVEFYIDNALVLTDQKSPYSYSWDTTKYTDGLHTIKATAYDTNYYSQSTTINARIANIPVLSISVNPKLWGIGSTAVNSVITMSQASKIAVTNDGSGPETFELKVVNPAGWTSSATPGTETYVLSGLFCNSSDIPTAANFNQDASTEDIIGTVSKKATNTIFGYSQGTANGVAVPSGQNRSLYLQFKSPTATQRTDEQNISVIVSCQTP